MISQRKINAYYNAINYAHRHKKTSKCYALSNRLHRLEKQYWDSITASTLEDEIKHSKLPERDYPINTIYHDVIINSLFLPATNRARINKLIRSRYVVSGKYPIEIGGYDKHTIPDTTSNLPFGTNQGRNRTALTAHRTFNPLADTMPSAYPKQVPIQRKKRYRTIVRRNWAKR